MEDESASEHSAKILKRLTDWERSPVYRIVKKMLERDIEGAKEVIEQTVVRDYNWTAALLEAALEGNKNEVDFCIKNGAKIDDRNSRGWNALMIAAFHGQKDVVEVLIEKGAYIDARNFRSRDTALTYACSRGHVEIAEMLLDAGADVHAKNSNGKNSLILAIKYGKEEVIRLLKDRGAGEIRLVKGPENKMVKSPMSIRGYNEQLLKAAMNGELVLVNEALERGADINTKSNLGETALMRAVVGNLDVARFLIEKGIEVNSKTDNNTTAVIYAAVHGSIELTKLLIKQGAEIHSINDEGRNALFYAAMHKHDEVVKLLIENGADVTFSLINLVLENKEFSLGPMLEKIDLEEVKERMGDMVVREKDPVKKLKLKIEMIGAYKKILNMISGSDKSKEFKTTELPKKGVGDRFRARRIRNG